MGSAEGISRPNGRSTPTGRRDSPPTSAPASRVAPHRMESVRAQWQDTHDRAVDRVYGMIDLGVRLRGRGPPRRHVEPPDGRVVRRARGPYSSSQPWSDSRAAAPVRHPRRLPRAPHRGTAPRRHRARSTSPDARASDSSRAARAAGRCRTHTGGAPRRRCTRTGSRSPPSVTTGRGTPWASARTACTAACSTRSPRSTGWVTRPASSSAPDVAGATASDATCTWWVYDDPADIPGGSTTASAAPAPHVLRRAREPVRHPAGLPRDAGLRPGPPREERAQPTRLAPGAEAAMCTILYGLSVVDEVIDTPFSNAANGYPDARAVPDEATRIELSWRPNPSAVIADLVDGGGAAIPRVAAQPVPATHRAVRGPRPAVPSSGSSTSCGCLHHTDQDGRPAARRPDRGRLQPRTRWSRSTASRTEFIDRMESVGIAGRDVPSELGPGFFEFTMCAGTGAGGRRQRGARPPVPARPVRRTGPARQLHGQAVRRQIRRGGHVHSSLSRDGTNVFAGGAGPALVHEARHYLAGLREHDGRHRGDAQPVRQLLQAHRARRCSRPPRATLGLRRPQRGLPGDHQRPAPPERAWSTGVRAPTPVRISSPLGSSLLVCTAFAPAGPGRR